MAKEIFNSITNYWNSQLRKQQLFGFVGQVVQTSGYIQIVEMRHTTDYLLGSDFFFYRSTDTEEVVVIFILINKILLYFAVLFVALCIIIFIFIKSLFTYRNFFYVYFFPDSISLNIPLRNL